MQDVPHQPRRARSRSPLVSRRRFWFPRTPFSGLALALALGAPPLGLIAADAPPAPAATASTNRVARAEAVAAPRTDPGASQVVEVHGKVEVLFARDNATWEPAKQDLLLHPGDRLRTRADSRAAVQLSDRSVLRLDQNSTLLIREPVATGAQKRFRLDVGRLFFLNRERPSDVEFETPLAVGAIRGTEFLLAADEGSGTTRLALFDGAVHLASATETLDLAKGQEVVVPVQGRAQVTAALPLATSIQWAFYYPLVVDPSELGLAGADEEALREAVRRYAVGDLLGAPGALPSGFVPTSVPGRIFLAALKLGVGQVDDARRALGTDAATAGHPASRALQELILSVTAANGGVAPTAVPTTASEWLARSYHWQALSRLTEAREAARAATRQRPEFGHAWIRLAELELSFGDGRAAREALARGRTIAAQSAQGAVLEGFSWLENRRPDRARAAFDEAIRLDPSLGTGWLGRGLCATRAGDRESGRRDLQVAAALEPQRGVFRSYLAKAFAEEGRDALAEKDLRLARELDPADPTGWYYTALHDQQTHRYNDAVRALEKSVDLNDGRGVFRSRLLLDEDRSMRSADLARLYDELGLAEVGQRAASRAIDDSYLNFSGHLFLARALQQREDPARYDLRWETARQSELLLANLLAPAGAGNLSQYLSQQDLLRYFEPGPLNLSSSTEYRSTGGWDQSSAVFGSVRGLDYAVDAGYTTDPGHATRDGFERLRFSLQAKQQLGLDDDVYLQVGGWRADNGDVAQHYAPEELATGLRAVETQEPHLAAGWHHAWSPDSHLLVLGLHYQDHLELRDPRPDVLFVRRNAGGITGVETIPFLDLDLDSTYRLEGLEVQQVWQGEAHDWIIGGRLQGGEVDTTSTLRRSLSGVLSAQDLTGNFEREALYAYHRWKPLRSLQVLAGVAYDRVQAPVNADLPPLAMSAETQDRVEPKVGITWSPWTGGELRGAYAQSLGGLYFDNSLRLEPAQLAGFTTAYRSLIPESVSGLVPGSEFETAGVGFHQAFRTGTYAGVDVEWLSSTGERGVGALSNGSTIPVPDTPAQFRQQLDFRERSVSAYVVQLLDRDWSVGGRVRWSEAELDGGFSELPSTAAGVDSLTRAESARLGSAAGFVRWNHPSGWFAAWQSEYWWQSSDGYAPVRPDEAFWQHDVTVGYRFARRRAEVQASVLNLTDEDYRLNPLNAHPDLPRGRTLVLGLRLNF